MSSQYVTDYVAYLSGRAEKSIADGRVATTDQPVSVADAKQRVLTLRAARREFSAIGTECATLEGQIRLAFNQQRAARSGSVGGTVAAVVIAGPLAGPLVSNSWRQGQQQQLNSMEWMELDPVLRFKQYVDQLIAWVDGAIGYCEDYIYAQGA